MITHLKFNCELFLCSPNPLNLCVYIHIPTVKYYLQRGFRKTGTSNNLVDSFYVILKAENDFVLICNALFQVDAVLRHSINPISLPTISAIVIYNDTVLWTGNFGNRNGSDPKSTPPNEYTIYRWVLDGLLLEHIHSIVLYFSCTQEQFGNFSNSRTHKWVLFQLQKGILQQSCFHNTV